MPKVTSLAATAAEGHLSRKIVISKGKTPEENQFIEVRGFSPEDALRLVEIHGTLMNAMFEQARSGEIDVEDVTAVAAVLLRDAPAMLADAILIAMDAERPDLEFPFALKLPAGVQTQALKDIVELTLVDRTPGEFLQTVVQMLKNTGGLLRKPLTTEDLKKS